MPTDEFEGRPELIKKRARTIFLRNTAIAAVLLYMLFSSGISTWSAITGYSARHQLLDCTTSEGECFQRNQADTGDLVQAIVDEIVTTQHVSILAAGCSTDPTVVNDSMAKAERIDAIDTCVRAALKKKEEGSNE
jgi:hypothetical protein